MLRSGVCPWCGNYFATRSPMRALCRECSFSLKVARECDSHTPGFSRLFLDILSLHDSYDGSRARFLSGFYAMVLHSYFPFARAHPCHLSDGDCLPFEKYVVYEHARSESRERAGLFSAAERARSVAAKWLRRSRCTL